MFSVPTAQRAQLYQPAHVSPTDNKATKTQTPLLKSFSSYKSRVKIDFKDALMSVWTRECLCPINVGS